LEISMLGTIRRLLTCCVALSAFSASQPALSDVIYRATSHNFVTNGTVTPPSQTSSISPPSASGVSINNGTTTGMATFTVKNSGGAPSGILSLSLSSSDFVVVAGGTCVSGSTTLAAGAECTVKVARAASDNDADVATGKTGVITASFAGTPISTSTATVQGSASGYPVLPLPSQSTASIASAKFSGISVRCARWDGKQCSTPQMNVDGLGFANLYYGSTEIFELWCDIATGSRTFSSYGGSSPDAIGMPTYVMVNTNPAWNSVTRLRASLTGYAFSLGSYPTKPGINAAPNLTCSGY
jgi:hypothetical protein